MPLPTVSWDENSPLGSQAISLGDDRIREMKTQVREVIAADHIFASSGTSATAGFHNWVTLVEQASKPTTYTTNQIALYGKEVSSKTELFLVDEAGVEHQLTSNYLLNLGTVSGTLAATAGGTGLTSYTQGDTLYASAANTLSVLAKNTTATRYLSNTGSSNNPAWAQINIPDGLTIASQAQGDIIYASSGAAWARLGAGTSGQFLKTQGAGANPVWATVTLPVGYNLVSTTAMSGVATSSNIAFTSSKMYLVKIILTAGGGDAVIRFNGDSTVNHYQYRTYGYATGSSTIVHASSVNGTSILLFPVSHTPSTEQPSSATLTFDPQGTASTKQMNVYGSSVDSADKQSGNIYGWWSNSAEATYFNVITAATMSGTVYLYELTTS